MTVFVSRGSTATVRPSRQVVFEAGERPGIVSLDVRRDSGQARVRQVWLTFLAEAEDHRRATSKV